MTTDNEEMNLRHTALQLALQHHDEDPTVRAGRVIRTAAAFVAYIHDGTIPETTTE